MLELENFSVSNPNPMKSFLYLVVFVVTMQFIFSPNSFAASINGLYSDQLPVLNQSIKQRDKVMSKLFGRVLVKVSGYSGVLENIEIQTQLSQALSYTTEFNFSRVEGKLHLSARFNEQLVDKLLKSVGMSIWGTRRPSVMLWLAYQDDNFERHVINENSATDYPNIISQQSTYRGMPILLPVWDLDDQMRVSITDIWGLFSDKVASANMRYQSDFMIIAKISQHGVSSQISWAIYKSPNNVDAFDIQPAQIIGTGSDEVASFEQALAAIIDQSTDFFSRQYSVDTMENAGELAFNVANIDSIDTYVAVSDYLMSLKAVESLQVTSISNNQFTFRLEILGDHRSLLDVISLEKKLISEQSYRVSEPLLFQWYKNAATTENLIQIN